MKDKIITEIKKRIKEAYRLGYKDGYHARVLEETQELIKEMKGKYETQ